MTSDTDLDRFVPKSAASFNLERNQQTRDVVFLLMPHLSMIAFSSAIEPLRVVNQLTGQMLYRWHLLSQDGRNPVCSNGVELVVAGGPRVIDRTALLLVCAGITPKSLASKQALSWIRGHRRRGGMVGGICTGAFVLAEAGLLENRRFTVHWENRTGFLENFPDLSPTTHIFEADDGIVTSGGGNGSMDMMLSLIAADHGEALARAAANMCIHGTIRNEAVDQVFYRDEGDSIPDAPKLASIIQILDQNLENTIDVPSLASKVGLSRRQVERLFRASLGVSPAVFYEKRRLERARSLLIDTPISISEIAAACGFRNAQHLSQRFDRHFGTTPHRLRRASLEK
jgi:transcriptional regulator GlxA family with amidase domain